tara:strand:- start:15245 stop:15610 length:366 start_codon:yes stop_codon:yes gene_type:complete
MVNNVHACPLAEDVRSPEIHLSAKVRVSLACSGAAMGCGPVASVRLALQTKHATSSTMTVMANMTMFSVQTLESFVWMAPAKKSHTAQSAITNLAQKTTIASAATTVCTEGDPPNHTSNFV